ncbi:MAG: ATP-binding protein [Euryarchaeota archaeon]|nr:ATP-binding protein [Euryarchaeota archaeon]
MLRIEKGCLLCSVGGVVYIRIGTSARPLSVQEILMLASEMGTIQWDEAALLPLTEVKNDFMDWFFMQIEKTRGKTITEPDRDRYLRRAGAIRNKVLTNAGALFFTDATEFLPHARIRLIAIEHNEPVWSKEYEGPVWHVIDSAYTDLIREIKKIDVVIGAKRVKIEEYPPRALREAIINAVAHRNYTIHADVRIFIHPDRIEIKNPGGLLPGVDLDDPEHVPRNPAICNLLHDTGFIERYGLGIRLICEETEKHPISSVTFDTTPNRFTAVFKKNLSTTIDDVDAKILELVIDPMKSSNIASSIGVSKPTVIRRLKKLEQLRLIRKMGGGAHTRYTIRT